MPIQLSTRQEGHTDLRVACASLIKRALKTAQPINSDDLKKSIQSLSLSDDEQRKELQIYQHISLAVVTDTPLDVNPGKKWLQDPIHSNYLSAILDAPNDVILYLTTLWKRSVIDYARYTKALLTLRTIHQTQAESDAKAERVVDEVSYILTLQGVDGPIKPFMNLELSQVFREVEPRRAQVFDEKQAQWQKSYISLQMGCLIGHLKSVVEQAIVSVNTWGNYFSRSIQKIISALNRFKAHLETYRPGMFFVYEMSEIYKKYNLLMESAQDTVGKIKASSAVKNCVDEIEKCMKKMTEVFSSYTPKEFSECDDFGFELM